MTITGKDLIDWGFKPGPWFKEALKKANLAESAGCSEQAIKEVVEATAPEPQIPLKTVSEGSNAFEQFLAPYLNDDERLNYEATMSTMAEVMRTPVAEKGVLMPDACPAGPQGTIPVGGVVASKYIHPGWHSADICCSMCMSVWPNTEPRDLLDAVHKTTHFGGGGRDGDRHPFRDDIDLCADAIGKFNDNPLLRDLKDIGVRHMGTQGDGNHFSFVGTKRSTGETCLVTHHGSRKPGAMLYKLGIQMAAKQTRQISPETLKQNAWISDPDDHQMYWEALQIIRGWTRANHTAVHVAAKRYLGSAIDSIMWNEHNFVFYRDGLFWHAKGATPMWDHNPDQVPTRIIPLNMASPILLVEQDETTNPAGLGFAPHGAGRNYSRSEHMRRLPWTPEEQFLVETDGLDVRSWTGEPDISELPSAYKPAGVIESEIKKSNLATIVDYIDPYGSLMAGNWRRGKDDRS